MSQIEGTVLVENALIFVNICFKNIKIELPIPQNHRFPNKKASFCIDLLKFTVIIFVDKSIRLWGDF